MAPSCQLRGRSAFLRAAFVFLTMAAVVGSLRAADRDGPAFLNQPVDVSGDFRDTANTYFLADQLTGFDPLTHSGRLRWVRAKHSAGMLFNNVAPRFELAKANEWPAGIYAADPELPFAVEFISASTLRIRIQSSASAKPRSNSLIAGARAEGRRLLARGGKSMAVTSTKALPVHW